MTPLSQILTAIQMNPKIPIRKKKNNLLKKRFIIYAILYLDSSIEK